MIRLLLLNCLLLATFITTANTIVVKDAVQLREANKKAQPGDIIILQNGVWKDVEIRLDCKGNKAKPITFRAETAGMVRMTGNSQLRLGGSYIVVDGLYFTDGYAGDNTAVINFRMNKDLVANHCRVTNCSINNYNNPRRMDENYWISFSGKQNRLDHCSFKDKKNIGVLLAVTLEDDQSRENFHSIDHNYFGRRPPLGSNGGEMIRVGVSQHCQFNSNTQITDNFFEECDGETEIVSIKSGSNVVRNNVFKECQGSVVLRHGDYNTVENNLFLGNNKEGTGGVRIINKGQWVVNNFFYECRGTDFRSPLAIMNGVPNSAAFRYVQVTDAVIANNSFVNCTPISFCEGSDQERSLPPDRVSFLNNLFYNDRDSIIYRAYDNTNGFSVSGNEASRGLPQLLPGGFRKVVFTTQKGADLMLPNSTTANKLAVSDSLQQASLKRLRHRLPSTPGFIDLALIRQLQVNSYTATGNSWFKKINTPESIKHISVRCNNASEVYAQLERKEPVSILLTGENYLLDRPFIISKEVVMHGGGVQEIDLESGKISAIFKMNANGHLTLQNTRINGAGIKATQFITSDSNRSDHYNLAIRNCTIRNLDRATGCLQVLAAGKSMIADSIIIRNSSFSNIQCDGIMMIAETDNKGYYNAEKIIIANNEFTGFNGTLVSIYRGGNDESTMGPYLSFIHNKLNDMASSNPLLVLTGVQQTRILSNSFVNCNPSGNIVLYKDIVRAKHIFEKNTLKNSGRLEKNMFVTEKDNTVN